MKNLHPQKKIKELAPLAAAAVSGVASAAASKAISHFSKKEDVGQVDEISQKTATSYLDKARQDPKRQPGGSKEQQHRKGWSNAMSTYLKGVKEDAEHLNELSKDLISRYTKKAVDSHGHASFAAKASKGSPGLEKYSKDQERVAKNRRKGIARALGEDTEQLTELSKGTLSRYIGKASNNAAFHAMDHANYGKEQQAKTGKHHSLDKAKKRLSGVQQAAGKLAKEDAEQVDELNVMTLSRYASKARSQSMDKDNPKRYKRGSGAAKAYDKINRGDYSESVTEPRDEYYRKVTKYLKKKHNK